MALQVDVRDHRLRTVLARTEHAGAQVEQFDRVCTAYTPTRQSQRHARVPAAGVKTPTTALE